MYPGLKFNKFHGAFCVSREFVHKYHMAGIVSEESSESFNSVPENIKDRLKGMPATTEKAKLMCDWTQGNTRELIVDSKRKIANNCTGRWEMRDFLS